MQNAESSSKAHSDDTEAAHRDGVNPGNAETESLASIDRPPSSHEGLPPSKIYHPLSFPVVALLVPASIFGVLARLGLQALGTYEGQAIFPLAYAQAVGCLIMGFGLELKEPIGRFYGPLYTALTTGFCGSLTTFSGWQLDVFNSWINSGQAHRPRLRNAVDGIGKSVFTLTIALGSVAFGHALARLASPHVPTMRPPPRLARYALTLLAILTYAAAFPAYFRLPPRIRADAPAALLFAFPGTLARYLLALLLNQHLGAAPLGTLAANALGTALLGMLHVLQSAPAARAAGACALLQGLADGFCGCLTTVSTFATEVRVLGRRRAAAYALGSWAAGQLLLLVILGPAFLAGAARDQITCRYA